MYLNNINIIRTSAQRIKSVEVCNLGSSVVAGLDTPATPAAGGRHQAGHYTVTGGVHHHGLYRVRPDIN